MTSKVYQWLSSNGGTWSFASNWNDTTDGIDPSLTAPGAGDSVTVAGPAGASVQTMSGPGAAALAAFTGNTHLAGSFVFGTLVAGAGGAGGLLDIQTGDSLTVGAGTLTSGSLLTSGGTVAFTGSLSIGGATLYANTGGTVQSASLFMGNASATITIDPTAAVEIGLSGGAATGALTVDASASLAGQGNANAYGAVVNNGVITAQGGTLALGALTGAGTLAVGAGATLKLNGRTGAGQAITLSGALATLAIATEFDSPAGTISSFGAGDAIDMLGSPITGATYTAGNGGVGTLTLTYGGQAAEKLLLAGNYVGDVFLPSSDGAGGTDITVAPAVTSTGGPSPGTATPDSYVWTASGPGAWNVAANWQDVSAGTGQAAVAPGAQDLVAITGGDSDFLVVAGPGNAAHLSIAGALALSGATNIGTLSVGTLSVGAAAAAVLDLLPGAVMTAQNATVVDGGIDVAGQGATLTVAGTLLLGGGPLGVGLPTASLSASEGAAVTLAGLALGGGAGAFVTTDPTSSIVIGSGAATDGAVTVGGTLTGNGTIDPFGTVIDNGVIEAAGAGGTLILGPVSGIGALLIDAGATLELLGASSQTIGFASAPNATLVPTLALGSELALPAGTLGNFLPGDVIDVLGDPISGINLAHGTSTSTITLLYGSTAVGRITLAGSFAHQRFLTIGDGSGGTDILLVQQAGGSGGSGGSGSTDTLAWAMPISGAWDRAGNWYDVTTGAISTIAPGTSNAVVIAGPANGNALQAIAGPGGSSSLLLTGNTVLNEAFTTGTLGIGTITAGVSTAGTVEIGAASSLAASGAATLAAGALAVSGLTAVVTVGGTLTIGGGTAPALLSAASRAVVQLDGLVLAPQAGVSGADVEVDSASSIEIGTIGSAATGALTIDAGVTVSGAGSLGATGNLIDNGTIIAQGGTLLIGAFSGTGTLDIGTEATLALAAAAPSGATDQIVFQGGGATLELAGSAQAMPAIIAGFAPGDAIVTGGAAVTSVAWTQAAGHGTLTLTYGSQSAGTLLLAGDYSADIFAVQPDGLGSEITVAAAGAGGGGPPAGTTTPDTYIWTGDADSTWANPANWEDQSASQTPALLAPGLHDLVTIAGTTGGGFLFVQGPANAASLTLQNDVALAGSFAIGALSASGILAIGAGDVVTAAMATTAGGIEVSGGTLAIQGALALTGGAGSVLTAAAQGSIGVQTLALSSGSAVVVDATSSIDVGSLDDAIAGAVTIDQGGTLSGAGALDIAGQVIDDGSVIAAGGTLSVGAVSGSGTLRIGEGADLSLQGPAGSGLVIDFTATGTLSATVTPAAAIAGFGESDAILLPFPGADAASYAPTGAGTGLLTITGDGETLGVLTLLGMDADSQFSVSGAAGGGTILSTTPSQNSTGQNGSGGGGSSMSGTLTSGGQVLDTDAFIAGEPQYAQAALNTALAGLTSYVWVSSDGSSYGPPDFGYANVAIAAAPPAYTLSEVPYGYHVLIAGGSNALYVVDDGGGNDLLIGNSGNDQLVGGGTNDTLIGGLGASTDFFAVGSATMVGGGNDTFVSNYGTVNVTTAVNGHSHVWLGPTEGNDVVLNGYDTVASNDAIPGIAYDVVRDEGAVGTGDLVVGPSVGELDFYGGAGRDSIVGHAGTTLAYGGTADNNLVIGTTGYLEYLGGTGSATVVVVAGQAFIKGGAGAITVFGGLAIGEYSAQAGNSYFVVGGGPSTVTASAGNVVWLIGSANVTTSVSGGGVIAWGANSTGNNRFEAGNGPATLVGGIGNDLFVAGTGNATLLGGGGADVFSFTSGAAGGTDLIKQFDPVHDTIALHGYAGSAASVLASETVSGGSTMLALSDGTHITLAGVVGLTAASFTSS